MTKTCASAGVVALFVLTGIATDKWLLGSYLSAINNSVRRPNIGGTQTGPLGNAWVGWLERCLFFLAGGLAAPLIIAVWLGFKAAVKWEVWNTLIQNPSQDDELVTQHEATPFEQRRYYGSWLLNRLMIGTLANLLVGGLSGLAVRIILWGVAGPLPGLK